MTFCIGQDTDTPFATRVRGMTSENFLACVSMCFENLLQALHRADAVFNFVQKYIERTYGDESSTGGIIHDVMDTPRSKAPKQVVKLSLEEQDLVLSLNKSCKTSCCELAQRSLTQLLSLRKDANSKVYTHSLAFVYIYIYIYIYTYIHALVLTLNDIF